MDTDLEISQKAGKRPVAPVAAKLGIPEDFIEPYGKDKAKISLEAFHGRRPNASLILVTAINPTKAGEGKTTTSIGLADSLSELGKKTALALREPSLGPVFGLKGGAAGGGYAQVIPMEDINLHFTGDLHAITAANNLIAACIDNHIHFGNELDIQNVRFRRCLDINDRMLRDVTIRFKEETRKESFNITVASEIMAVFCLAENMDDLRTRIARIVIGENSQGKNITVDDLGVTGSVVTLLKDALKPNLVQTLYGTPAFVHGGPFANIAHGCNSVIATKMAMSYADYVVTEAGFGADLGAEKFVDIKCRSAHIAPDAIVLVATIRALKLHGGADAKNLTGSDPEAVRKGFANLLTHYRHMSTNFGRRIPVLVALNLFHTDTEEELAVFDRLCGENGMEYSKVTSFRDGKTGAVDLAERVIRRIDELNLDRAGHPENYRADVCSYELGSGLQENIRTICRKFYEVSNVIFSETAERQIQKLMEDGCDFMPVCVAKTPYALNDGSDDPDSIHIQQVLLSAGAGFVVVKTGEIVTMPGLPRHPLANVIDFRDGNVTGMM